MKTVIVYVSVHHGNTKKLVDAIAEKNELDLIDATRQKTADLSGYDRIGFASGIDYGKFYPQMLKFIEENLPENKKVFLLYTYGSERKGYTDAARQLISAKNCELIGEYGCPGFDTYGPLKMIGGIAKGHPTAEEIAAAAAFFVLPFRHLLPGNFPPKSQKLQRLTGSRTGSQQPPYFSHFERIGRLSRQRDGSRVLPCVLRIPRSSRITRPASSASSKEKRLTVSSALCTTRRWPIRL